MTFRVGKRQKEGLPAGVLHAGDDDPSREMGNMRLNY